MPFNRPTRDQLLVADPRRCEVCNRAAVDCNVFYELSGWKICDGCAAVNQRASNRIAELLSIEE